MKMNIIFSGPPGSGKDEACEFLKRKYNFRHLQFKDDLFIETAEYFKVSLEWFMSYYNDRRIKERPEPQLNGMSRREAMIHVSENIIKPRKGKDYFGLKTAAKIDDEHSYCCFSDGGFIEEVIPLINRVGVDNICIVQLYRIGCSFSSDSRTYIDGSIPQEEYGKFHSSTVNKNHRISLPIRMYRIHNNTSVSDFHNYIRQIIRKEANVYEKSSSHLCGKSL